MSSSSSLGPISASPQYVADALIDFASLTATDVLFDIGCNDGRVVLTAARVASAQGVGIELNEIAAAKAQQAVVQEQLEGKVTIVCGDALLQDLTLATVVFLYLLPGGMKQLTPKLEAQLRPGCRIITYMFKIPEWHKYLQQSQGVTSKDPRKMDVTSVSKLHLYVLQ